MCPIHRRKTAWSRLVRDLPASALESITPSIITLSDLPKYSADLLAGKIRGRLIVDVRA
jgi:acrylyl-CoA reductase (NADPH)